MANNEQLSLVSVDQDIINAEGLFKDLSESENIAFEQQIQGASVDDLMQVTAQLISELSGSESIDRDKLDQVQKIQNELATRQPAVA